VVPAREEVDDIVRAIRKAISPEFASTVEQTRSLYGQGDASRKIAEVLRSFPLDGLLKKSFHAVSNEGVRDSQS
jgi:GDP/UDP-N,N'-diacetylbacillosamine 2-epimerase (hydrolysing)